MKQFKKVISIIIALTMSLSLMFAIGCGDSKKVELDKATASIALFNETTITATLTDITEDVEWTTSDDTITVITANGKTVTVLGIKAGTATITATAGEKSATCAVTVTGTDSLLLTRTSEREVTVPVDAEITISANLTYKNAAFNKQGVTYTYSVSDASPAGCVAIENGVVVAKQPGTATVSLVASYYGNNSNAVSVDVTVESATRFGSHDMFPVVEEGIIAKMTEGKTLAYEGITFGNDETQQLIRFQIVQAEGFTGDYDTTEYYAPVGAENIYITIQDAADADNYVTVFIGSINVACADAGGAYYSHACVIGATSNLWFPNLTTSSEDQVFAANKFGTNLFAKDEEGWVGYDYGCNGYSFYNAYLEAPKNDGDPLTSNMVSIAIKDSSIYFNINNAQLELLNLGAFSDKEAWGGFTAEGEVNVYVTTTNFGSAGYTDLVVDMIGGRAVTEGDLNVFEVVNFGGALVPQA